MIPATPVIDLVSVNIAIPSRIGERQGKTVLSGIRKVPLKRCSVVVTEAGIIGDGQGDTVNHGGYDKAVYAYPSEHLDSWSQDHGSAERYSPGEFGENLSVRGMLESDVLIGDRWRWGEVVLEVCQPRYPCYKLAMVLERPAIVREMVDNRRTGWYLRVIQAGAAPVDGAIEVIERGPGESVLDAHLARLPQADTSLRSRVAENPSLAARLRDALLEARENVSADPPQFLSR
ncbi:MAG: MOSC domain-containing protein [Thermomicrobiales bacterium]